MNVALVGYGDWGKLIEKYLENNSRFELTHVFSRSIKNHPKGTNNLNDLLENGVQAVFLAVPIEHLVVFTELFLKEKRHVFCEKPLSSDPNEIERLFQLASKNKVCLYVNYIYTHSLSINFIKSNLDRIGTITHVDFQLKQFGKFYGTHNSFEILGCHMLAVYFHLFGSNKKSNLKLFQENIAEGKVISIEFKNGNSKFRFKADLLSLEKYRSMRIFGSNGLIMFSPLSNDTVLFYNKGTDNSYTLDFTKSFDENNNIDFAINYFFQSIAKSDFETNKLIAKGVSVLLNCI